MMRKSHVLLLVLVSGFIGCGGSDPLIKEYGRSSVVSGGAGVGGTSVLAGMFRDQGCSVEKWNKLWPKIKKYDTVVWIPDRFMPPTQNERTFLETWLRAQPNRTLIYVGRDYDPISDYWQKTLDSGNADDEWMLQRKIARAKSRHQARRGRLTLNNDYGWFRLAPGKSQRVAKNLSGADGWLDGIDTSKTEIRLGHSMLVPKWFSRFTREDRFKMLVKNGNNEMVVASYSQTNWNGSKIMLVNNGSFLLNLPLINHQHRKLATKLVGEAKKGGSVIFLESGMHETAISDKDPKEGMTNGLEMLTTWPTNIVLMHLIAIGIVYCFSVLPIFGRPKEAEPEPLSDFNKHIEAVAELMAKAGGGMDYVRTRYNNYQNLVRSGTSHEGAVTPQGNPPTPNNPAPPANPYTDNP